MILKATIYFEFLLIYMIINKTVSYKFTRNIEAIGIPYYKISMTLGNCKKSLLFKEEKVWPTVRLNRVMDIYYKSSNSEIKVSEVNIYLITNNTYCVAFSDSGVGSAEFTATIFYATNVRTTYYKLMIFTCDQE